MPVSWGRIFTGSGNKTRSMYNSTSMQKNGSTLLLEYDSPKNQSVSQDRFGNAATLELSDDYLQEKQSFNSSMLLESKAAARTLKVGSKGDDVKRLQENLNTLGYNAGKPDGIFGNGTKNAVMAFQKAKGLTADGIVGTGTHNAITRALNEKAAANNDILKVGSKGAKVTELQRNLNTLGYNAGTPDGAFGNGTKNAVISFQKTYGLTADGIVGKTTQKAISESVYRKTHGIVAKGQISVYVKNVQNDLKTLGYLTSAADGVFGTGTEAAVKAFQKNHNLTQDGMVGSATRNQISIAVKEKIERDSKVLKLGSKGDKVRTLQTNLNSLGYKAGTPDGQFGSGTQDAVIRFQKTYGLTADGQAGPNTQEAIAKTINYKNKGILSKGQVSESVASLQRDLKTLGYLSGAADGAFGTGTEAAVKAFQKNHNLTQDGLVGTNTMAQITAAVKKKTDGGSTILKLGSKGDKVRELQNSLKELGYAVGTPDGNFGNTTKDAVIRFQKIYGLTADGQVGPTTQNAINKTLDYKRRGILSKGQISDEVAAFQWALNKLGYLSEQPDGIFGKATEKAIRNYQVRHNLTVDGLVSKNIKETISTAVSKPDGKIQKEIYKKGDSGEMIKQLQNGLKRIGYSINDAYGVFGESTDKAVKTFQRAFGLSANGYVDKGLTEKLANSIRSAEKGKIISGHFGDVVADLQKALKAVDIFRGEITGIFDKFTLKAYAAGKEKMRNNYSAFAGATKETMDMLTRAMNMVDDEIEIDTSQTSENIGEKLIFPDTGTQIDVSFGIDVDADEMLYVKGRDAFSMEFSRKYIKNNMTILNNRLKYLDRNYSNNVGGKQELLTYDINGKKCYAGMMVNEFGKIGDIVELSFKNDNTINKVHMILVEAKDINHTQSQLQKNSKPNLPQCQCVYGHGYKTGENEVQLCPCEFIAAGDEIYDYSATNYNNGTFLKNSRLVSATIVDHVDIE